MKFDYQIIQIKDKNNNFLFLKPVAITVLIEFSWQIQSILNILSQLKLNLSSAMEIKELVEIKILIKNVFAMAKLNIDDFELTQINELFDLIQDINNLKPKSEKEDLIKTEKADQCSLHEYVSRMVTMLVNLDLALDLKEAWEIAGLFPQDQLESLINARILQVDPDFEKKEKDKKGKEKLMNGLIDDIKTGFIDPTKTHKFIIN